MKYVAPIGNSIRPLFFKIYRSKRTLMPFAQGYQKVPQRNAVDGNSSSISSSRSTISEGDVIGSKPDERSPIMAVGNTAGGNLPTTYSSQQLMSGDAESVTTSLDAGSTLDSGRPNSRNSRQYATMGTIGYSEWFTVSVLCFVNLINYMDRFTIAGKFCVFSLH